jgi:hypothetical protein
MKRPKWLNKEVYGWGMFDFANQAFTLVILTSMFQVYFIEYIVGEAGGNDTAGQTTADDNAGVDVSRGMYLWSAAGIVTQIIILFVAPVLGALADFSGSKKKLLFITWLGCVLFTASLSLIPPGAVILGMTLFIIAYLFYVWLVPPEKREDWVRNARSLAVIEATGEFITDFLPADIRDTLRTRIATSRPSAITSTRRFVPSRWTSTDGCSAMKRATSAPN